MAEWYIAFTLETPRGPGGGLLSVGNRMKELKGTVGQVYRLGGQKFLDRAAAELENIPSRERYRAWHTGKHSEESRISLASRITSRRNMVIEDNTTTAAVRIFDKAWMTSVAPHWAAIQYGSSQNVRNADGWLVAYKHPGGAALHGPGGPRIGKLVKIGTLGAHPRSGIRSPESAVRPKVIRYAGGSSFGGGVHNPIRPGRYLDRAYSATIRDRLEKELSSRIRGTLSRG